MWGNDCLPVIRASSGENKMYFLKCEVFISHWSMQSNTKQNHNGTIALREQGIVELEDC